MSSSAWHKGTMNIIKVLTTDQHMYDQKVTKEKTYLIEVLKHL